eukprot:TRINITY_DN1388_c0_g1_i1.p1 TRINITY_DN1388_c0_g1~~TRINITY_DN1388_c0_g1_i1.p1  ORF type:complete len:513 (+),score=157.86 TRINITY_DN1388_c0_g1_i1:117-1655(+)
MLTRRETIMMTAQNQSTYSRLYSLKKVLYETDYSRRKTKMVCTIGPKCWDPEILVQMLEKGMSVARLNFSHGDHKLHGETVEKLREAFKRRKDFQCAIMLDTKGPEIRTGLLKEHKTVNLTMGQTLEITTDYTFEGDENKIACSYVDLPNSVKVGSTILIADGSISCRVKELKADGVIVEVLNSATLGEKKNMNLPGIEIKLPTVTEKDENDIVEFGLKYGIDMIALSFTRFAKDIETVRDLLGPRGAHIKIFAKIENHEGLEHFDEIVDAADGIMVARGDLGMEIPPQKVFVAQKWMIKKCKEKGKPVITATQMMESMIKNPRPTRAEASDVANAVLDGSDCVMLSGETANGDYPLICVDTMAKICTEAELCFDYESHQVMMERASIRSGFFTPQEAIAVSAVRTSMELEAKAIVVFALTDLMPRLISKYEPYCPIMGVSVDEHVMKALTASRGVVCLRVPSFQGTDQLIQFAIRSATERRWASKGDYVVVIHSTDEENPDQSNVLKILTV